MSFYRRLIVEIAAKLHRADADPAQIEEFMRDRFSTLDHLTRREFAAEVRRALSHLPREEKSNSVNLQNTSRES